MPNPQAVRREFLDRLNRAIFQVSQYYADESEGIPITQSYGSAHHLNESQGSILPSGRNNGNPSASPGQESIILLNVAWLLVALSCMRRNVERYPERPISGSHTILLDHFENNVLQSFFEYRREGFTLRRLSFETGSIRRPPDLVLEESSLPHHRNNPPPCWPYRAVERDGGARSLDGRRTEYYTAFSRWAFPTLAESTQLQILDAAIKQLVEVIYHEPELLECRLPSNRDGLTLREGTNRLVKLLAWTTELFEGDAHLNVAGDTTAGSLKHAHVQHLLDLISRFEPLSGEPGPPVALGGWHYHYYLDLLGKRYFAFWGSFLDVIKRHWMDSYGRARQRRVFSRAREVTMSPAEIEYLSGLPEGDSEKIRLSCLYFARFVVHQTLNERSYVELDGAHHNGDSDSDSDDDVDPLMTIRERSGSGWDTVTERMIHPHDRQQGQYSLGDLLSLRQASRLGRARRAALNFS
ncbi:hypothetical protein T439DRAFT_357821 [Meredithblackwellia eburnea MCA 4105]